MIITCLRYAVMVINVRFHCFTALRNLNVLRKIVGTDKLITCLRDADMMINVSFHYLVLLRNLNVIVNVALLHKWPKYADMLIYVSFLSLNVLIKVIMMIRCLRYEDKVNYVRFDYVGTEEFKGINKSNHNDHVPWIYKYGDLC